MRNQTYQYLITELQESGYVIKKIGRSTLHLYILEEASVPLNSLDTVHIFEAKGKYSADILGDTEIRFGKEEAEELFKNGDWEENYYTSPRNKDLWESREVITFGDLTPELLEDIIERGDSYKVRQKKLRKRLLEKMELKKFNNEVKT